MSKGQRQEGGDHYDRAVDAFDVIDAYGLDFYAGNVVKYVMRAGRKDGLADLLKAEHYLEICIRHARGLSTRPSGGPNQDAPDLSDSPEPIRGGPCRYCGRDFSHGPWEGDRDLRGSLVVTCAYCRERIQRMGPDLVCYVCGWNLNTGQTTAPACYNSNNHSWASKKGR